MSIYRIDRMGRDLRKSGSPGFGWAGKAPPLRRGTNHGVGRPREGQGHRFGGPDRFGAGDGRGLQLSDGRRWGVSRTGKR